ncbi:conserved hypothetical protein [Sporisorium reilianum SRZ2]|uniref:RING-type domain-containing protein n=1 Tax=Sporisorium reilianum (strain SRZ2) TaxID=999809 RepID=E6ZMR0_SPORE|nr:conserved hypothetical protein [Sporisorium reilianum SRZ2]
MSSLLSFARAGPAHRTPHDEEAAVASSSTHPQRSSRWSRPFGIGSSSSGNQHALAVEMSSQPSATAQTANNSDNLDIEQGQPRHERGASGRSILSAISIPSLSNLRQRDSDRERRRQDARVQAQGDAGGGSGTGRADGAALTSLGGGSPLATVLLARPTAAAAASTSASASAARTANKKSRSTRREREEAATLFGPNLANYFGSAISSSGAVSSHGAGVPQPAAIPVAAPPLPSSPQAADDSAIGAATTDTSYPQNSLNSRRARLGSRGRARGASLSGLSVMSLGAESVTSLGVINAERTVDTTHATGMMHGSTADLIDQLNRDGPSADGSIAMSEGIDIGTLQRWIQRSTGIPADAASADAASPAPATCGPPVCTTLQSFVNLKRNTLKLSTSTTTSSKSDAFGGKASDAAAAASADANILRSRPSLSVLPTLSYGSASAVATPAGRDLLPEPTHALYFEYDCAAPYASVQIFIRASRKHGSWLNWTPSAEPGAHPLSSSTNDDGSPAWLAQCGPPPHVLGWPVHVAKLKKGFGVGHTANIPLHLQYYAPPKPKKADPSSAAAAAASAGDTSDKDAAVQRASSFKRVPEPPTPAAIPETPGFEFNRRLELDADDADEDAANTNTRGGSGATAAARPGSSARTDAAAESDAAAPSLATEGMVAEPVVEQETKEQRLAREKAERETLKLAIVVEALDDNARPLREPNLQTSYLRLTSLPVKKPVAERLADLTSSEALDAQEAPRTWSSQMEGQEAEIGPHRFQLQELYGLSSKPPAVAPAAVEGADDDEAGTAPPPPPVDLDASNGSECLICLSSPPTTLLLPCTHGLCLECAVQLRDSVVGIRQSERRRGRTPRRKYACPVCRRAYTSMLHLSKADEKAVAQQLQHEHT